MDLAPPPPGRTAWDPRTAPYTAPACRSGRHKQCPGGMGFWPDGIVGECVDIPCACTVDGCSCAVRR
ncbi:hypothetical protein [Peterkaempfera sp. SMS 1(5)a]|uniref:hypothetical protein n=1 Tax=Peterkaempfera podocarpi TaxID=3232308 RepID=UPI00366FFB79